MVNEKKQFFKFNTNIFFLATNYLQANEIYIVSKVDNQIITNGDVQNELKYLELLNPSIKKMQKKELFFLSKNSLIREKIKEIEIKKYYNLDNNYPFVNKLVDRFINKLNLETLDQLKIVLRDNGLNYEDVLIKIKIESLWNNLIFKKYVNQVKINEEKIKSDLKQKDIKSVYKKYSISEILFNPKSNSDYENDYNNIKESIIKNGFANTASKFSISETSKYGGKIGFIREDRLDLNVLNELKKINIGETTDIIKINSGYLILKLEDIQEEKLKFDFEKEFKKKLDIERNKKFNQFSLIYFNKVKSNILIK